MYGLRFQPYHRAVATGLVALCMGPAASFAASNEDGGADNSPKDLQMKGVVIESPYPVRGGDFGASCTLLDLDGDGNRDLAIGAPGEERVYVAQGADPDAGHRFSGMKLFSRPSFSKGGLVRKGSKTFGTALAAGNLDDDPADEFVIGEPGADRGDGLVFVYGLGESSKAPLVLKPLASGQGGRFGWKIEVDDLDGDGIGDLVVSESCGIVEGVGAGRLHVIRGPFVDGSGGSEDRFVIPNPAPSEGASFGHALAVRDLDDDGISDLVVSAPGNTSSGVALAGQVFVFNGPVGEGGSIVLEDPDPNPRDPSRFGMDLAVFQQTVAVGSPRKNGSAEDAGQGFVFRHPGSGPLTLHNHPFPEEDDILGFRTGILDVSGNARPEVIFVSLKKRGFYVWDGARIKDEPRFVSVLPDSDDHYAQGITTGQLFAGDREEVVLGDPTWDRPGEGKHDNSGRIVIYHVPTGDKTGDGVGR